MKHATRAPLWVIGWREWISMPDLGIERIKAKIDTGARSSALHAIHIERFRRRGRDMVRFDVHPQQRNTRGTVIAEAELIGERRVRSSSGHVEVRPVVLIAVKIRGRQWLSEFTLTSRYEMGYRVLLGRRALRGRFLIDTERSYMAGLPSPSHKPADDSEESADGNPRQNRGLANRRVARVRASEKKMTKKKTTKKN